MKHAIGTVLAFTLASALGAQAVAAIGTVDGGGRRAVSASYTLDGSIGGVGGNTSAGGISARQGYVSQLTEVNAVSLTGTPAQVNEGATSQLIGTAMMDDGTVTALAGGDLAWGSPAWPIQSISPGGLAAPSAVYANTPATVSGRYLGVFGTGALLVLDDNPDNYGVYAGDQIADGWQVRHFGTNNLLGVAGATNCTGQINLYSYTADLDPTNPASVFRVVAVSNQAADHAICFGATSTARVYRLLYATDLVGGVWTDLPGKAPTPGLAGQMSLCDTNATALRFYRVQVQLP